MSKVHLAMVARRRLTFVQPIFDRPMTFTTPPHAFP